MKALLWTKDQDYALAFGAALGMSARQIAGSFGGGMTRNAIIGRTHRLGLSLSGVHPLTWRTRAAKVWKPKTRLTWTLAQDEALRTGILAGKTSQQIADEVGHTLSAVTTRRQALGYSKPKQRFSEQEDEIIKADYAAHIDVHVTAQKLQRSWGTVRQRIVHLGLVRDARKTQLANRFGAAVLAIADDPAEIRRVLSEKADAEREQVEAQQAAKVAAALSEMVASIGAGADRIVAFKVAMLQGATLQEVGDQVGLTRERIRQLIARPPAQPRVRTLTCVRCEDAFEASGSGYHRYCASCLPLHAAEVKAAQVEYRREYQRAARKTGKYRVYKREWTRRDRLKKKLLALAPSELGNLLRSVADGIDALKQGGQS